MRTPKYSIMLLLLMIMAAAAMWNEDNVAYCGINHGLNNIWHCRVHPFEICLSLELMG